MKMKASFSKKLRYGGLSLTLTALIIAAVIIVNVIFSVLTQYFMLYSDLTPPLQFTLSEAFLELIEKGDDSVAGSGSPIDMIKKFREENKKYNEEYAFDNLDFHILKPFNDLDANCDINIEVFYHKQNKIAIPLRKKVKKI